MEVLEAPHQVEGRGEGEEGEQDQLLHSQPGAHPAALLVVLTGLKCVMHVL